jgi:hypothetical protein
MGFTRAFSGRYQAGNFGDMPATTAPTTEPSGLKLEIASNGTFRLYDNPADEDSRNDLPFASASGTWIAGDDGDGSWQIAFNMKTADGKPCVMALIGRPGLTPTSINLTTRSRNRLYMIQFDNGSGAPDTTTRLSSGG